jgi:hypothetical protein
MKVAELVARARGAHGIPTRYSLGAGGIDPSSPTPANVSRACDCSGFVCWALGISRKTDHPLYKKFNGGWINTDAMVVDGNEPSGFFSPVVAVTPGSIIVYPSVAGLVPVGHVGIVTSISAEGGIRVIHCSKGNDRRGGDAIDETDDAVFKRQASHLRVLWFSGLEP